MEGLTFRKFEEQDLPRISDFRKSFFSYNPGVRCYEPQYYRWKCYKNPLQQGEMWLAEDKNIIVGLYNITPKRMKILGTVVSGAEVGDAFTRADYQRRGILTELGTAARDSGLNKGISFIYGVPNEESRPGHVKNLGYRQVPIKIHNLIKPVNMKQPLKVMLRLSPLAAFLSSIIKIISDTASRIGAMGNDKSNISISRASSFPDDIGIFSEQSAQRYDNILVRSEEYLEWRYIQNPDTYTILLARNKAGATVGYMVTKVGFYSDTRVRSMVDTLAGFIVDFLTLEDDKGIFKKLLLASLKDFLQSRVNFVSTWTIKGSFYDKLLLKFGFIPYGKATLICYQNELGSQVINKNYKWHFTMGDSDGI